MTTRKVDPRPVALAPDIAARIAACEVKVAAGIAALEDTLDDDPVEDFDEDDISTVKNITAMLRSGERARRESTKIASDVGLLPPPPRRIGSRGA